MEEGSENPTPSTARIFVGGLGESVTADELRRVFHLCGGAVDSIDFVRTKGRSFAYVDFSPSSNTSLSILFAKYNGCVWKGGKLRLEKAKEHYLNRLAREWAEADSHGDAHQVAATPASSQVLRDENIRIFFPRLRKVKALPLSGTGKHKYSFQRMQVPSLPKYFCGCEEHSGYSEKPKQIHLDGNGIHRDEVNIMNKVMNVLFQKQNHHSVSAGDESLEPIVEEDDLLINVVSNSVGNNKLASSERHHIPQISHFQGKKETLERKQKREWSEDASTMQKREPPSKKKKQVSHDQTSGDEFKSAISASNANFQRHSDESNKLEHAEPQSSKRHPNAKVSWSQKSSWKELINDSSSNTFCFASTEEVPEKSNGADVPDYDNQEESLERDRIDAAGKDQVKFDALEGSDNKGENENLVSDGQDEGETSTQKTEGPIEAQPVKPNKVSSQTQGSLWMQRFSWTQLVGRNCSFSLSGGTTSDDKRHNGMGNPDSAVVTKPDDESMKGVVLKDDNPIVTGNNESCTGVVDANCNLAAKQISPVKVVISETCTFMRSEKSLKEWTKTKAALRGSLKRKVNQK